MVYKTTVEMTDEEKQDADIIEKARACLKSHEDRENDNIHRAEEAIRFRALDQWPDAIKRDRENSDSLGGARPCPVMDKTNQNIRIVVNEERMNRAAIRYRPVDDDADERTAEVLMGIVRHIEYASSATSVYTNAGEQAIDGGFGYFRIIADYCDPMSFDQDIRIKRIVNRFSVALGPHSEPDGSDAEEGLIYEDIPRDKFKAEYPEAKEVSFETGASQWSDKEVVRVAEYYKLKCCPETIHQLDNGEVVTDKEFDERYGTAGEFAPIKIKSRETTTKKLMWYKVTAEEVLDSRELVGSYIPIVKVIGEELILPDGTCRLSGMVEPMIEPQRLHNYSVAGYIEDVALAPRSPWIAEETQIEGYEQDYEMANRMPVAVLKYKATVDEAGQPLPQPMRQQPAGMSPGWQVMLQNTEAAVQAAIGMYGPSQGQESVERSGIALREQKTQGSVGNYHYHDNLSKSIQHGGRILLQWIPEYYDTERTIAILGEDNSESMVKIDPMQSDSVMDEFDQYGQRIGETYNLKVGKFDVTVTSGPSYTSKRDEATDRLFDLVQTRPELMSLIGDIIFRNADMPYADSIADRLKTLLPPEIRQMEESKESNQDPKVVAMMAQIDQMSQSLEARSAELAQAEQHINNMSNELGADKTKVDAAKKELTAERRIFAAEVQKEIAQIKLMGEQIVNNMEDATKPVVTGIANASKNEKTIDDDVREMIDRLSDMYEGSSESVGMAVQGAIENLTNVINPVDVASIPDNNVDISID